MKQLLLNLIFFTVSFLAVAGCTRQSLPKRETESIGETEFTSFEEARAIAREKVIQMGLPEGSFRIQGSEDNRAWKNSARFMLPAPAKRKEDAFAKIVDEIESHEYFAFRVVREKGIGTLDASDWDVFVDRRARQVFLILVGKYRLR